ncbi:hypothetical protein HBI24_174960 [Parastagonospora nodorum]|nr:hypothetical protein HBI62_026770 [Parastagonospora nodorum]KAH5577398.1 hypothetical protein HBI24_174960 [Parastagonospora nodorum]KAH5803001.1 hypothetical protein HBI94_200740 [Parastagonospora nodorum]KAH5815801.1 hypothetical protein HBI93_200650 [Parastagonospora nodorum]KAH5847861.1 hypothetical protein HBI91_209640 [Parastagonospora nodorum]
MQVEFRPRSSVLWWTLDAHGLGMIGLNGFHFCTTQTSADNAGGHRIVLPSFARTPARLPITCS